MDDLVDNIFKDDGKEVSEEAEAFTVLDDLVDNIFKDDDKEEKIVSSARRGSSAGRGLQPRPQLLCCTENISDGVTNPVRLSELDDLVDNIFKDDDKEEKIVSEEAEAFTELDDLVDLDNIFKGDDREEKVVSEEAEAFIKLSDLDDDPDNIFKDEDTIDIGRKEKVLSEKAESFIKLSNVAADVSVKDEDRAGLFKTAQDIPENAGRGIASLGEKLTTGNRKPETGNRSAEFRFSSFNFQLKNQNFSEDGFKSAADMEKNDFKPFFLEKEIIPSGNVEESVLFQNIESDDSADRKRTAEFTDDILENITVRDADSSGEKLNNYPRQKQDLPDLPEVDIEKEVENLFEEPDGTFSDNDAGIEEQEPVPEEKPQVPQKEPGSNLEGFLEQLVKKIVSEKIESIIIDERRVIDVIEKAVKKERNKLIKELTGDE